MVKNPDSQDPDVIAKAEPFFWPCGPMCRSSTAPSTSTPWRTVTSVWHSDGPATSLQARDRAAEAENGVEIAYNAPIRGCADVV